jgi:transcriptional regulator with XRE-family HTH domain
MSISNKVKKIRTQLSISQRELAERAGTSQQQIQRIEAGKITTSLTVAKAICIALGKPLEIVFPDAAKALNELRSELQETRYITDEALSKVSSGGIEADTRQWWFKVFLKGQQEPLLFPIDAGEKRRLYSIVQDEAEGSLVRFAVFDTAHARYAVNLSEVSFCQFLSDAPRDFGSATEAGDDEDKEHDVLITMIGGGTTIGLNVPVESSEEEGGQLAHILYMIEGGVPDASDRYRITDVDGEDAFIRVGSIALLQVSLWALGESGNDDEIDD